MRRLAQACTSAWGCLMTHTCRLAVTLSKHLKVCAVGTSLKTWRLSRRLPPAPPGHFCFHHLIGFPVSQLTCCLVIITPARPQITHSDFCDRHPSMQTSTLLPAPISHLSNSGLTLRKPSGAPEPSRSHMSLVRLTCGSLDALKRL